MRRRHATPRSPPPPAELKWLYAGRTFEGEFSKITSYAERNPICYECQPQVQRVLACRQSTARESVPTIAFLSADDVFFGPNRHLSRSSFKSLGRWILIFFFGL